MPLRLTKNEKKVLKFLLKDARMSDSAIAEKLAISSQAVGKIRRKLEDTVISFYTLRLDYSKMGVQIFAISLSKLTPEGMDLGELDVENKLLDEPNIIQVYRIPSGSSTHIIFYGFHDMEEMDFFFHSAKKRQDLLRYIENRDIFTFSHHSLIKNDPNPLFQKIIDGLESDKGKFVIAELENFKKRIS
jgi:DNA-binding Lrp family transcriptional regulator